MAKEDPKRKMDYCLGQQAMMGSHENKSCWGHEFSAKKKESPNLCIGQLYLQKMQQILCQKGQRSHSNDGIR